MTDQNPPNSPALAAFYERRNNRGPTTLEASNIRHDATRQAIKNGQPYIPFSPSGYYTDAVLDFLTRRRPWWHWK